MEKDKDIATPIAEKQVIEQTPDIQPTPVKYVEISTFENLKKEYENLRYDFLELKNSLKPKDETPKEKEKTAEEKELEEWII